MKSKQTSTHAISTTQARRIALSCQLLGAGNHRANVNAGPGNTEAGLASVPNKRQRVLDIIRHLGYVQIDTISVIERAHHHTLWVRHAKYSPDMLDELLARDRRVFEYWGHAASYLPIEDYRYYLPKMKGFINRNDKWHKERFAYCRKYLKPVMERIRDEGPLTTKDFEDTTKRKGAGWWNWKPAKVALETLMWQGDLIVCGRRNFQRMYDLTERFLPADIDTTLPTDDELGDFLVNRALQSYGIATLPEIKDHIRADKKKAVVDDAVARKLETGDLTGVNIEGDGKTEHYIRTSDLERFGRLRRPVRKLHLLSPFDNLVIQRDRMARLFGFDYTIECYLPAAKRKHGYFVLPILWGERIVGRLDPKADRKTRVLKIERLKLEDGFAVNDGFVSALADRLNDLARFCGCERVAVGRTSPTGLRQALLTDLKRQS